MSYKRGEIYYVDKNSNYSEVGCEQSAGRPAVIVSNKRNNEFSRTLEVVFLTTQPKNELPTHVDIRSTKKLSTALCEQITTVSIDRIGDFVCNCTDNEMAMIDVALAISLGLETDCTRSPLKEDAIVQISDNDASGKESDIKLKTERNTYKKLYEQLLERILKA